MGGFGQKLHQFFTLRDFFDKTVFISLDENGHTVGRLVIEILNRIGVIEIRNLVFVFRNKAIHKIDALQHKGVCDVELFAQLV